MSLKKSSRAKSLSLSDNLPLRASRQKNVLGTGGNNKKSEDTAKTLKYIDDNVIGKGIAFFGPFGRRRAVFADYTTSGRSLQFLEDYINKEVLPLYGDISIASGVTGLQSRSYHNEAREIIRLAVNASIDDEIIFCDNPNDRLSYLLCQQTIQQATYKSLQRCCQQSPIIIENEILNTSDLMTTINNNNNNNNINNNNNNLIDNSPILFVSSIEPIKNLQSWIDCGCQIERIAKNREGYLDLVDLEKRLGKYVDTKRKLIGLFSGASRLTGILADDMATTYLLHQYGALSIWDYSSAIQNAQININPALPDSTKDALFFNANCLIGGTQAPSVLIIKKSLTENYNSYTYDSADVISTIRAGLVIQLKESLGTPYIMSLQEKMCKQILSHIRTIPEIVLLGSPCTTAKRLTTLCFLVRHPRGAFLHHRFVVAVLNDIFGIQVTSEKLIGDVLGIPQKLAIEYEKIQNDDSLDIESLHPGYIRISFPFFMSETEIGFILEALKMVATEAWKILPEYEVNNKTGEWRHYTNALAKERKMLGTIRYTDGKMLFTDRRVSAPGCYPQNYPDCLQTARNLFNRARKMAQRSTSNGGSGHGGGGTPKDHLILKLPKDSLENLRWFMLPGEAHELLLGHSQNVKHTVPFDPNKTNEPPSLLNMHRHNSLSALDVKRFKSRSLPASPIQIPVKRQFSSPTSSNSPTPTKYPECASPPPTTVRFSLGGEVTTNFNSSPQVTNLIANESGTLSRNRCYSWGSTGAIPVGPKSSLSSSSASSASNATTPAMRSASQTRLNHSLSLPQQQIQLLQQNSIYQQQQIFLQQRQQLLNYAKLVPKTRSCSCSSQTDLSDIFELFNLGGSTDNMAALNSAGKFNNQTQNRYSSPTPSLQNLTQAGSSCSDYTEDIQAYVKEVSEEIATELKSEIREVISKVEDVLENSESSLDMSSITMNSLNNLSSAEELKRDSVSVSEVAEYLKEFSIGIASEVKSEIRGCMNDLADMSYLNTRKNSPPDILEKLHDSDKSTPLNSRAESRILTKQRYSDVTPETNRPKSADADKQRSESFPSPSTATSWQQQQQQTHQKPQQHYYPQMTAPSPEISTPNCPYTGAISKLIDPKIGSSHDSGINMCFHDVDEKQRHSLKLQNERVRSIQSDTTDSCDNINLAASMEYTKILASQQQQQQQQQKKSTTQQLMRQTNLMKRTSSDADSDTETGKWLHLPKDIWKQSAEALDEFEMIRDGDKILVCVSGSSASMCLLHVLRQFTRARGLHVDIGAISVGVGCIDPRALMLYMRDLGVEYFIEEGSVDNLMIKLTSIARKKGYNILAMGNTLDKLADNFLVSLLQKGRLQTTQAVYSECNVRVIRPFIYVREHNLEDFAVQKGLPTRPSRLFTRPPDSSNSILKVQELINPNVYDNIKTALKPLLSLRLENNLSYEFIKTRN